MPSEFLHTGQTCLQMFCCHIPSLRTYTHTEQHHHSARARVCDFVCVCVVPCSAPVVGGAYRQRGQLTRPACLVCVEDIKLRWRYSGSKAVSPHHLKIATLTMNIIFITIPYTLSQTSPSPVIIHHSEIRIFKKVRAPSTSVDLCGHLQSIADISDHLSPPKDTSDHLGPSVDSSGYLKSCSYCLANDRSNVRKFCT